MKKRSVSDVLELLQKQNYIHNLSEATMLNYSTGIKLFSRWLESARGNYPISKIKTSDVEDYILWMRAKGIRISTINFRLRTIRRLFFFCA